jgi:CHAD domain-containing protein
MRDLAAHILEKRHRKLKKQGRNLLTLSSEERHAVRIAAKKLRYAAEFLSSLYPKKRTQRYIQALAHLQELLGVMNDAATTRRLLQDIETAAHEAARQQAKGIVLGWVLGGSHMQLSALEQAWNEFADRKEFWSANE